MALFSNHARRTPDAEPLASAAPTHIAIIMDGNGRWARARGLPRAAGHKKGVEALHQLLEGCRELNLRYLTLYAFSSENWNRPAPEVSDLMELLRHYLSREIDKLHKGGIRLHVIGDRSRLDPSIQREIAEAEQRTSGNTAMQLNVALSYGGRQEIMRAVRRLAEDIEAGTLQAAEVDEAALIARLDTQGIPDPDLLIRTGGEQRLSNFLLWQSAYTELFFTSVLWPDFTMQHLKEAIAEYAQRERRYGTTA